MSSPERRLFSTKLAMLVTALAAVVFLALVAEEVPRILYPWDWRMFSESALLTDMMKLTAGQPPYTRPEDCNSFLYAPGLEYLTYALLRPFGAQLDIRACRLVTVLAGLASAFVAGRMTLRFAVELGAPRRRIIALVAGAAAALLIFKSYTADACHPDNLYGLHAMVVILLASIAIEKSSFRVACAAVAVAGLGVAVKQTALPGVFGALAVIVWLRWRSFGVARSAGLAVVAALSTAAGAAIVFHGYGTFWALDVPSHQEVELIRVHMLVAHVLSVPHRFFLLLAFVPSVLYLAMRTEGRATSVMGAWLAVGATEVLPSLASYFKVLGWWNNLTILDLWAAIPVFAVLAHVVFAPRDAHAIPMRALAGGFFVTFFVALTPTRSVPTHGQYEFGRAMDAQVAADAAAKKKVLVSIGAATLIHNGLLDVPLDRASSVAERAVARQGEFADTKARFASRYYDKLYVLGDEAPGYPPDVQAVIDANYHPLPAIPGDGTPPTTEDLLGIQGLMRSGARVYEANR